MNPELGSAFDQLAAKFAGEHPCQQKYVPSHLGVLAMLRPCSPCTVSQHQTTCYTAPRRLQHMQCSHISFHGRGCKPSKRASAADECYS